jgi:hypothetical protein
VKHTNALLRLWAWSRGPSLPLLVVIGALSLNLLTFRDLFDYQWPVVAWQMYRKPGPTAPVAKYRRFVTHHAGGQATNANFEGSLPFLAKPYRFDAPLKQRRAALLATVLGELRKQDPEIDGVSVEQRAWSYKEQSLDQSLERDPPTGTFRAMVVAPPAPELRAPLANTRLANGGFEQWDGADAPAPDHWQVEGSWLGIGVGDLANRQFAVLLPADARVKKRRALRQRVSIGAVDGGLAIVVHATALVRAEGPGSALRLEITAGSGKPLKPRTSAEGDSQWHRLDVSQTLPPGSGSLRVSVLLTSSGQADAYFDDVALFADPAPAPSLEP